MIDGLDPGFYWVEGMTDSEPQVAYWDGRRWYPPGTDEGRREATILSNQLEPPK